MTAPISRRSVILSGIEVLCSIGLHDFEKEARQRLLIDLEVALDPAKELLLKQYLKSSYVVQVLCREF